MEFENILYAVDNHIATITINRPDKLNALNIATIRELGQAMEAANQDGNVRGIILTGMGAKAFVAGADIAEFAGFSENEGRDMAQGGHNVFDQVENLRKPVIAAISGFALGGGCELAMSCHMRVAASNARFGQPEVNLGLIPGYGGTQRMVRLIGRTKATELLLTGDMINAEEAKQLGLVNHVVEPDALIAKCTEILDKVAQKSPLAVGEVLHLISKYYDKQDNGFHEEIKAFGKSFITEDFKEGTTAFLEKRKPSFTGR